VVQLVNSITMVPTSTVVTSAGLSNTPLRDWKIVSIEVDEFHAAFLLVAGGNVQRCKFGQAIDQVFNAFFHADYVTFRQCLTFIFRIRQQDGAHACRKIDHNIGFVLAHPCHGFPEQIDIPAALACFRVPDMEMDDGSAGLRCLNG